MGDARNDDPTGMNAVDNAVDAARKIEEAGVADESAAYVDAIGETDDTPDGVTGERTVEAENDAEAHPS